MSQSGPSHRPASLRRGYWIAAGLGIMLATAAAATLVYLHQVSPARSLARVREDWDAVRKALSGAYVDWSSFPSDTSQRRRSDPSIPLTFEWDVRVLPPRPTPSTKWPPKADRNPPARWPPHLLTTPVAYMQRVPEDPFQPGSSYGYTCFNSKDEVPPLLVLHSAGPNRQYEITTPQLRDMLASYMAVRIWSHAALTPQDRTALKQLVGPYVYDPTNGMRSAGDLVRLMDLPDDGCTWGWERETGPWANTPPLDNGTSDPAQVVQAWQAWKLGMLPPPPASAVEAMNRTRLIPVPAPLAWHLGSSNLFERDTANPRRVSQAALDAIRAKLGAIGGDVWDHPRPLTAAEKAALERAPRDGHLWWGEIIPNLGSGMEGVEHLRADEVYRTVALLGLSQIALALRDASSGQTTQSLARISFVRAAVQGTDVRGITIREQTEKRTREELERLFSATERVISEAARK